MPLYNTRSAKELREEMLRSEEVRSTISFYQYAHIQDVPQFRDAIYAGFEKLGVMGRVYVAAEGINAQISCPEANVPALREFLDSFPFLQGLRLNIALDDDGKSFWVLKVKIRARIVADGIEDPEFDIMKRGKYLGAAEYNALAAQEDTIVIDMRNHYEYEVGHFENAIEIPSDTFREQLPMAVEMMQEHKDKNIIMYCTGGIRCEKASAYFLHKGFENVYHIEGGIINYVNKAREQGLPLKFKGKNFVFDGRLGERITEEIISKCHQCGAPCDTHINCANEGCHLLFIQCENCSDRYDSCCSDVCKEIHALPEEEQKLLRKGMDRGQMIFNKSKQRLEELARLFAEMTEEREAKAGGQ
ncbi:MAG: rhodanese-related sulfurtransferase [Bacteroidia bacterium]|nr:rhodanese-related sulfurtransferase [Bacteroidia bacterium]